MMPTVTLRVLPIEFALVRLDGGTPVPAWATAHVPSFVAVTADETSILAPASSFPSEVKNVLTGYTTFLVEGPLDHGLLGITASLALPLMKAGVPLFANATFDTDYLTVRTGDLSLAIASLRQAGHTVKEATSA
jgi:hypothetical protein